MVFEEEINKGNACFADEDFTGAIRHYSVALVTKPNDFASLLLRANAYIKMERFDRAIADCDSVLALNPTHDKALFRKGFTLCLTEDYLAAYHCFSAMQSTLGARWTRKCVSLMKPSSLAKIGTEHVEKVFFTKITETNFDNLKLTPPEIVKVENLPKKELHKPSTSSVVENISTQDQPIEKKDPFRVDWYQNNETVTVEVFIKNLAKDSTSVEVEGTEASITCKLSEGKEYVKDLELFQPATLKSIQVLSTKVSVIFDKVTFGKWDSLERSVPIKPVEEVITTEPTNPRNEKNWDKIVNTAIKKTNEDEDMNEADEKFYDDDIEDSDPMNRFFKQIFRNGTDEQKRAMMKSFQESGGTVLTTNWSEAGKGRVEPADPYKLRDKELKGKAYREKQREEEIAKAHHVETGRKVNIGGRDINIIGADGFDFEKEARK